MRIAIDVLSAALGGPGQYIRDLLPHLANCAKSDELHVLAAHPQLIPLLPRAANITIHDIPSGRRVAPRLLWQRFAMPAWLRRHNIDLVFAAQGLTALRPPPPIVVLQQDAMFFTDDLHGRSRLYAAIQRHFTRKTMSRAVRTIFVSDAIRSLAAQRGWLRPADSSVIASGVNTTELRAAADPQTLGRLRTQPPYIFSATSVMPHKNIHGLIDAMAELRRRGRSDIRLLIAGPAPRDRPYAQQIRRQIANQQHAHTVTLLGPLHRPALAAHYACARLYITLSFLEAHPLTPIEAMAFDLPVITHNIPAFAEVCGDAALVLDGRSPAAVADAIQSLWDNAAARDLLIQKGRARAAQFTWPRTAEQIYAVLQSAAREAGK